MDCIFLPTVKAMEKEGRPFKGCPFFGLMLTKDGPRLLEYNARLGDPETQAVLPLLKTDLLAAMIAVREGNRKKNTCASGRATPAAWCWPQGLSRGL